MRGIFAIFNTARLFLSALRDLMIRFLPRGLVRLIIAPGRFAFIVHPLGFKDASKKYPLADRLPKSFIDIWTRYYWPIVGSEITGFKTKRNEEVNGWIIICPLTPRQMMRNQPLAKRKILQSVKLAEKLGAKIVGLGAFTSILTHDGADLIGKVKVGLTTGNAYATALLIRNVVKIAEKIGMELKDATVAIVGAAGSVGSACVRILSKKVRQLILIDIDREALESLIVTLGTQRNLKSYSEVHGCLPADIVIAVSSAIGAIITPSHLSSGTIVIDGSQPKNVSKEVIEHRDDVLVIESGLAKISYINHELDLGIPRGEVYACLGEVLILSWKDWDRNYSIGKVDPRHVHEVLAEEKEVGLSLADFRNSGGIITERDIGCFKKHRDSPKIGH